MIILINDERKLKKLIDEHFFPDPNRKIVHIPMYMYKENENEKIYIHNNTIHVSDNMLEILILKDLVVKKEEKYFLK